MVMAQARCYESGHGDAPVLCLDDIASEIDADHLARVFDIIGCSGAQILATATERSAVYDRVSASITMFHVEQGGVRRQS